MDFNPEKLEIIDFHIHPPTILPQSDLSKFGFSCTIDEMVSILREAGISRACGSVIGRTLPEPLTFEHIRQMNRCALDVRKKYPDFFIPGIAVHPAFPEESCAELEYMAKEQQIKLVGELVSYSTGYKEYAVKEMEDIWALICELDLTVSMHMYDIADTAALLKRFPEMKLVIAHTSADEKDYTQRLELIRKYPNTALDISGRGPLDWGLLRYGINIAGTEKIIFGTDFPLRNPGMIVAGVYAEKLTDAERKAIFSGNAKRLLNI